MIEFVGVKSRVSCSNPAVSLVHGNDVGVVSIKGAWPKNFARNYLLKDPPQWKSWIRP